MFDEMEAEARKQYEAIIAKHPYRHAIYANRRVQREMERNWRAWCGL